MDSKIYNIKESDLGKITFEDGSTFIQVAMDTKIGRARETIIMKDIDECVKFFSTWAMQKSRESVDDPLKMHNEIIDWLVEYWLDGIKSMKENMYEQYGFEEFRDQDPIAWIKSEPEMVSLTLVHIAARFTNGYLKCPVNNIEIYIRFVKNLIGINFWEEGNPHSSNPFKNN